MPKRRRDLRPRRRTSTRYRKPAYKKRRRKYGRRSRTMRIPRIFPDKAAVSHKYITYGKVELSSGIPTSSVIFKSNGMFDPEQALGGHQPLLFDEMCALYNHYTVIGSKIKIKFWRDNSMEQDTDPQYAALTLSADGVPPINAFDIREQPKVAYTTVIAPSRPYNLSKGFSAKKFFGKNHKNIVGESELRGSPLTDPIEQAYYIFTLTDLESMQHGETDTVGAIHYEVEIIYQAVWTERKEISQS